MTYQKAPMQLTSKNLFARFLSLEPFENDNPTSLSTVNFSDYDMVNTNEILARKILQSEDWSRV